MMLVAKHLWPADPISSSVYSKQLQGGRKKGWASECPCCSITSRWQPEPCCGDDKLTSMKPQYTGDSLFLRAVNQDISSLWGLQTEQGIAPVSRQSPLGKGSERKGRSCAERKNPPSIDSSEAAVGTQVLCSISELGLEAELIASKLYLSSQQSISLLWQKDNDTS